ncbi:WW domain-binding protein 4 isoform X1 [Pituophis catenifer annectens]|uniref:WW domain-binding protein 4 isoform X1 n=1 Tax=Pituophis catenifer annectens TaxID=94852 RepID=UPI00399128E9
MADYWKSQPKKFCDYCKCWIADNKPSIDFHERGKNHKENVAKKISEIKQKSLDKAKEDEKRAKEFAAMEEAATKAYQEDLKRLGLKAEPVGQPSLPIKQEEKKEKKEKKEEKKEKEKKEKKKKEKQTKGVSSNETTEWVRGFSPEGYIYYYNTKSGAGIANTPEDRLKIQKDLDRLEHWELSNKMKFSGEKKSQWEKPEGFQDTAQNSETEAVWIEGTDDEGHTYYYNTETGVSTWEKPEGFVSYSIKNNPDENSSEEISKNESPKRKTGSNEEKPRKPRKISPYGEWQEVKYENADRKKSPSVPSVTSSSQKPLSFGKWEEITEEEAYEKVDLELPSKESNSAPVVEIPDDAKVIFKEKTVTSLGDTTEAMPVFRKRKFENGKSRNIRQRLSDH